VVALAVPALAFGGETVVSCGAYANHVFAPSSAFGITTGADCPGAEGGLNLEAADQAYDRGQGAIWQANAPTGLTINGATIPAGDLSEEYVNAGRNGQWGGDFYWAGGKSDITPAEYGGPAINLGPFSSDHFGFLLVCGAAVCDPNAGAGAINVATISLAVSETTPPAITGPTGLWAANGWVRGRWHVVVSGDSPSGMCGLVASFATESLPESTSGQDPSMWHQCSAPTLDDEVITQGYPDGGVPLYIGGWDAAGEIVDHTKTVYVDNQQPTVALSGPSDAPATSTQYVTATAGAGPSGVAGIDCSVDGGAVQWYPSVTAQVPVSGVGQHQVQCYSVNNAVDENGAHGISAVQSFPIKLGVPTVTGVAFSKLVDRLRCHRALVHTRVGRRTKTRRVTRCHVRSVRRRVTVWVTIRRHGTTVRVRRTKIIRVLLKPHLVSQSRRRVQHGHATTVNGWLGTATGVALGGQTVDVLTAADNGRENFHVAAIARTAGNGGWTASLPAGPSRLVEAYYAGGPTTETSQSSPVRLVVPAKVELLSVSPRHIAWGGTVRLTGRLVGGYLPSGGALVRLRIGLGSAVTTYGVREHVSGRGRFSTTYTFGIGDPATYRPFWFQVASLPMGDYPFAPANSGRVPVVVGGHPDSHRP
jgi:hypothetical protein